MKILPADNFITLITKKSRRYAAGELLNLLKRHFVEAVVFEAGGQIVGYAVLWKIPPEAELHFIEVFREFRGKGFGTAFLGKLLDRLAAEGFKQLFLEVEETNTPAVKLYKKLSFEVIGKRKDYYGKGRNALLMVKNLKD
jgi:ribosomal-protein-alanine N-acetyltransferase